VIGHKKASFGVIALSRYATGGQLDERILPWQCVEHRGAIDPSGKLRTSGGRSCGNATRGVSPAAADANPLPIPEKTARRSIIRPSRKIEASGTVIVWLPSNIRCT
jgi:hypothetical protein